MSVLQRSEPLQSRFMSVLPWVVWSSPVFFYFYQFIIRVFPSVTNLHIMAELNIDPEVMGEMASWYYTGYTMMQIPVGLLIDRIGVRRPLVMAALLCVSGCVMFAVSDSLVIMSVGRFLMGAGSAFGFLSCVKTASLWFSPHRLGLLIGLTMTLGTMGGIVGEAPLASMVSQVGWRKAIEILGYMGVILSLYAFFTVRPDSEAPFKSSVQHNEEGWLAPILDALKGILTNHYTYVYGLYGCMMYVPLSGFVDMWGANYISQTYDVHTDAASWAVTFTYFGVAIGSPLSALLADRLQSFRKVMLIGAVGSLAIFTSHVYFVQLPFYMLYPMYFALGVFSGTQFLAFAAVCVGNCHSKTGASAGIQNMLCMSSGIIFQPLMGYLLKKNWDGRVNADKMPIFSSSDYDLAMIVVPISLLVAALACLFMNENYRAKEE